MNSKDKEKSKLNFINLNKRFKEDLIYFYILTTLSAVFNYLMDSNLLKLVSNITSDLKAGLKAGRNISEMIEEIFKAEPEFVFFGRKIIFSGWKNALFFWSLYMTIYSLIVFSHVFYRHYIKNKLSCFLKKEINEKIFKLKEYEKEQILLNINEDEDIFSNDVFFYPNQIFYTILSFVLMIGFEDKANIFFASISAIIIALIAMLLNKIVYKKDEDLKKLTEKLKKQENIFVNNRNLIIKKNLIENYKKEYEILVDNTNSEENKRDFFYTLSLVLPSFYLIPMIEHVVVFMFLNNFRSMIKADFVTFWFMLGKFYKEEKKILDRTKDFPYFFVAKNRLEHLFSLEERNDIQDNILISENIEEINIKNLNFKYSEEKKIFENFNINFSKGDVNHLIMENGFGKSTLINLIMGINQPDYGEIIINKKYKLNSLNLKKWREKIGYAEHQNLIEDKISTGQKQLKDIEEIIKPDENKEIYIFDEASNALDGENKKKFFKEIKKISKNKIVIFVNHGENIKEN